MAETPPEVAFAQKLASNEQKVRDRALKKLNKYLTVRSSQGTVFTRDELSKLWKGLHYAMWAQDKPLVQEDLSKRLCNLLKAFIDPSAALEFAAAFFAIEANEWNRIDVFRMDKFMMLIRDFLNATLEVVKADGWKAERVAQLAAIIGEEVLDPRKENNPDGLRLYLADIYLDELNKVASEELESKAVTSLLEPFMHYVVQSNRDYIVDKITKYIFHRILEQTTKDGAAEEASKIKFDLEGICAVLFDLAKDKNVLQRNRKKVYKLIKRCPQSTVTTAISAKRKLDDDDDQSTEMPSKKTKCSDQPELNSLDGDRMEHLQELSETSTEAIMATTEDKLPETNKPNKEGKKGHKRKKKVQKEKNVSSNLKAELKKKKKKKMAQLVVSPTTEKMANQIKEGCKSS